MHFNPIRSLESDAITCFHSYGDFRYVWVQTIYLCTTFSMNSKSYLSLNMQIRNNWFESSTVWYWRIYRMCIISEYLVQCPWFDFGQNRCHLNKSVAWLKINDKWRISTVVVVSFVNIFQIRRDFVNNSEYSHLFLMPILTTLFSCLGWNVSDPAWSC